MIKAQWVGLSCLLVATGITAVFGWSLARNSPAGMADFKAIYYAARCVIEHRDPYQPDEFLRVYSRENGKFPSDPALSHLFFRAVPICINLPTSLFLLAPLSLVPWWLAPVLWMAFVTAGLAISGYCTWDLGRQYAPNLSLLLVCLVLANCQVLLMSGNLAGAAISFCVIAVWCFVRSRFLPVGIILFAISLAMKPQDAGLVWLYFLLASGSFRRHALRVLAVTVAIALPSILWVSRASPRWPHELRANLAATSARGDLSDPGPTSIAPRGPAMIIDLRTVVSMFNDNPETYTLATVLVIGALLGIWAFKANRSSDVSERAFLALGAVVPLSMLPVYHRLYDSKLLLLSIPAGSILWASKGWKRAMATVLTGCSVFFTGDIPTSLIDNLTRNFPRYSSGAWNTLKTVVLIRQVPVILLATGIFYLWIYIRTSNCPTTVQGRAAVRS